MKGLKVIISTQYLNNRIIFFEGETNESGLIEKIPLPTPKNNSNNLDVPKYIVYQVNVVYEKENINSVYSVNMYDGVCSVQNVNVLPSTLEVGVIEWQ